MSRIDIDTTPDGWFDPETSTVYQEGLRWVDLTDDDEWGDSDEGAENGFYVSAATGTEDSHQRLYHTADGRWVLMTRTDPKPASYAFISDSNAAAWREINDPPKPAPRRGRPEVGPPVHLRLSPELQAQVDHFASANDIKRAEAVRRLLTTALGVVFHQVGYA